VCAARFVPAAELSGAFYRRAVAPLLAGRRHAAALLGWGSDVLAKEERPVRQAGQQHSGEEDDGEGEQELRGGGLPVSALGTFLRYRGSGCCR
jgi:hypothetical protein